MNRIANIIWTARLCVAVFLLSVLFNIFPDFGALIDAEEWLANHSFDPVVVAFATGLVAIFLLSADVWLALRIVVALFWIACQGHSVPDHLGLTDAAQWLVIHSADSMLTAFAAGLTLATLASPGLWRAAWARLPAPSRKTASPAHRQEPTAPAHQAPVPSENPTNWAAAETALATAAAAQPEPWDIEPDTTTDAADEPDITAPISAAPETATFVPVVDETPPHIQTATRVSEPDIAPILPAGSEPVLDSTQLTVCPVSEPPTHDLAPQTQDETAAYVLMDEAVAEHSAEVAPDATPDVAPLVTPDRLAPEITITPVVEATPAPAVLSPVDLAPVTIKTAPATPAPEPWEITPTVTIEVPAQHGVAETTAEAPLTAAEVKPEPIASPTVASVSSSDALVLPASAAIAETTRVIPYTAPHQPTPPPETHPVAAEPWELAPTVSVEAETDQPVADAAPDDDAIPLPAAEDTALPPPPPEVTAAASVVLSSAQATKAETVPLAKLAVGDVQSPPPSETVAEPMPVAKAVSETITVAAAPEAIATILPVAPPTATDQSAEDAADILPDTVTEEEAAPIPISPTEDLPVVQQAVELESDLLAETIGEEADLTADAVETDLPAPERDISAEDAATAANDDPALPVTAFDVEPLPEPTLLPDMPPPTPARYDYWDAQPSFETWQAAWLWNAWEPREDDPVGSPSTARYLRLEEHLEKGMIRQVTEAPDGWMHARLPRQNLIDYAVACGERPKFLFPEERSWLASRLRVLQSRDVPLQELEGYLPYNEVKLALYKILRIINSEAVAKEVKASMRRGICEGVARRISGDITYGYERIPRLTWRRLTIDWLGNVSGGGHRYSGLMVKFKDGYLDLPQTPTSAVAAYDAINSYLREEPDSKTNTNL
ncbi:MAG: hypothetical protein WCD42_06770 [Rhizomicrobium sp.]